MFLSKKVDREKSQIAIVRFLKSYELLSMLLVTIMVFMWGSAIAQSPHKNLRDGDGSYYRKEYLKAEEEYRKALEKDEKSINGNHNLGNSLYRQERYEEAAKYFESAALQSTNDEEKAMSYHNLGNAYLSQLAGAANTEQTSEALNKSIDAYKEALKLKPDENSTKYNLAYAQKLYQQMKQQQQQPKNEGEGNPPPKEDNQENPSSGGGGEEQDNKDKEQPKPNPNQGESMTKEEAERLIKIMEEEERKVQEKMNKKNKQPNPSGKDW